MAVLHDVTHEIVHAITTGTASVSGWARLETACDIYLDKCADPTVRAILLRDAPRVVPRLQFDEIDHEANEPLVTGLLRTAIDEGILRPHPVALFARLLGAAFAEAGNAMAESKGSDETRRQLRDLLLGWLGALRDSSVAATS